MSLHQSRSLKESVKPHAHLRWVHSVLFSGTGQDGELAAIDCLVLRTNCDVVRLVEDPVAPADKTRLSARPVQKMHP